MNKSSPTLIFTDLDGTLLDLDNASWDAAEPALRQATDMGFPVILCSSRTFRECQQLQIKMNVRGPIVFENGGGVALPQNQFRRPSLPPSDEKDGFWLCKVAQSYSYVREILLGLRQQKHYQFRGFGDMTEMQISDYTGRDLDTATLAKDRRHSEALIWLDNAKSFDAFAKDIEKQGLRLTRGTHFIHVGTPCDKGQAVRWLISVYRKLAGNRLHVVALGDSGNDVPMLEAADTAVVIRPPHTIPLQYRAHTSQQLIISDSIGPEGWNEIVQRIVEQQPVHA